MSFPTKALVRAAALGAGLCLAAGACSSSSSSSSSTAPTTAATAAYPVSVASGTGQVTIQAQPKAIVSLSATATEMLFAIGAGPQVIAVDDQSDFPANAPKTNLSGFQPNVEAIAAKKPDLVVTAEDTAGLAAALGKIQIPVIVDPTAKTLADTDAQLAALGKATGHTSEASVVDANIHSQIDQIVASAPKAQPRSYYYELDQTFYSVTSSTFIGQLFKLFDAKNIADPADKTGSGYPQLSSEYIVSANPDVVFLADVKCCHQTKDTVSGRPGWAQMTAIKGGRIVLLDDDIASRWGPRVVELVRAIAAGLKA